MDLGLARGADAMLAPLRDALRGVQAAAPDTPPHRPHAAFTRYARSSIHQNAVSDETHVRVRAVVGKAVGIVSLNSLDAAELRDALATAAALARASRPDQDWPGVAEPEPIASPLAFDEATARADALEQAGAIGRVCAVLPSAMRGAGTHQLELTE